MTSYPLAYITLDPLAQQIGVGGIFSLLVIALVMKMLPAALKAIRAENGGHKRDSNKSGDLTPTEWEGRVARLRDQGNEKLLEDLEVLLDSKRNKAHEEVLEDVRKLFDNRNRELRLIFRSEMKRRRATDPDDGD
jgi:hypothetical protein